MMPEGIQRIMEQEGADGCFFLSILHSAEVESGFALDPVQQYQAALAAQIINADCFINDPLKLFFTASKSLHTWTSLRAGDGLDSQGKPYDLPLLYLLQPGEYDIGRWEWKRTPTLTTTHFAYRGPGGSWDPYGGALTIANGTLVSRRIFRKAA